MFPFFKQDLGGAGHKGFKFENKDNINPIDDFYYDTNEQETKYLYVFYISCF
jgi:hypothetical protein